MMYLTLNNSQGRTKLELEYSNDALVDAICGTCSIEVHKNMTATLSLEYLQFKYIVYQLLRDNCLDISFDTEVADSRVFAITGLKHITGNSGMSRPSEMVFTVYLEYADESLRT